MNFKLNFLGVTVADFRQSYRFYTGVLGIEVKHSKPGWAAFQTTGMKFELFSGGLPAAYDRSWGNGQAIRPSFHVGDLKSAISDLSQKGVSFVGDIQETVWGESIEFIAPEGIRWTLTHAPNYPFAISLQKPHIGWVEMKAHDWSKQLAFYTDVMGLHPTEGSKAKMLFRQKRGLPLLFLERGGLLSSAIQTWTQVPLLISYETGNIQKASEWVTSHNASVLQGLATHRWGIDFFITDVDGNPIQVVQYT